MGEQSVKNIVRPIRTYSMGVGAVASQPAPSPQSAVAIVAAPVPRLSIVALPFANLSNDPEQQYFADGLRGKHIVCRIGHTRRYEPLASGLRAMTALVVLRNKAIKPLLDAPRPPHPARGGPNRKPIDAHYHTLRLAMQGVFHELGIAA
jgi:hypothetical protein